MRHGLRAGFIGELGRHGVRWIGGALLATLAVALAGCGGAGGGVIGNSPTYATTTAPTYGPGHYPPTSAITGATTLRTSDFPSNHVAAFSATASNVATLQRFYAEMMALKPAPQGVYSCPKDSGVWEHVSFYAQGQFVLQAMIDEGGCGSVVLGAHSALQVEAGHTGAFDTRWYAPDTQFWPRFDAAFGTTQSTLQNGVLNNSTPPFAPTPSA